MKFRLEFCSDTPVGSDIHMLLHIHNITHHWGGGGGDYDARRNYDALIILCMTHMVTKTEM